MHLALRVPLLRSSKNEQFDLIFTGLQSDDYGFAKQA
jgi:hypothetical protein